MTAPHHRFPIPLPRPLWIGLAAVVLLVAVGGLRFGPQICRLQAAISEIEESEGWVETTRGGPDVLRRWIGDARMKVFDKPKVVVIRGRGFTTIERLKDLPSVTANPRHLQFASSHDNGRRSSLGKCANLVLAPDPDRARWLEVL